MVKCPQGSTCWGWGVTLQLSFPVLISQHLDIYGSFLSHPADSPIVRLQVLFSSVVQLCLTLCDPWTAARQASRSITNSQRLPKLMSIELVVDAMQPSHPLSSPSPPTFNLSQHQSLFE